MTELEELREQFNALCYAMNLLVKGVLLTDLPTEKFKHYRVLSGMRDEIVKKINTLEWG